MFLKFLILADNTL